MNEVKFDKIPYGLNEEQAREVFEYMKLRYRMQDVLDILDQDPDAEWFGKMTEEEQEVALEDIADNADDMIGSGKGWLEAVEDAIVKYEDDLQCA